MIEQVLADTRQVVSERDAKLAQMPDRIEDIVPARARLAVTLEDVAHLHGMIEPAGILRMVSVHHKGERVHG